MNLSDKIRDTELPYSTSTMRQLEYRFPLCTPSTRIAEFIGMFSDCYPKKPIRVLWDFCDSVLDYYYGKALQSTKECVPNAINDISVSGMTLEQNLFDYYHMIVSVDATWLDMIHLNRAVQGKCLMICGQPIQWCARNKEWAESLSGTSDPGVTFFPSRGHRLIRL